MSDLRNRISNLSPEKREELLRRLAERGKPAAANTLAESKPRRAPSEPAPLSFSQQRLWFLDRLEPGTTLFNLPAVFRLLGPLDARVLGQCFDAVVERHESLRTCFVEQEGQSLQVVKPPAPHAVEVVDLRALPAVEREAEVRGRITEEARRPFDLTAGPLMRTTLLRLAPEEHLLLLTMHHIVSDGWSLEVLVRELGTLYPALSTGTRPSLPELSWQYADFARWQQEWRESPAFEKQLAYWKQRLAGAPDVLELPTDRPRPAVQTFRGAKLPVRLPAPLVESLKALGRQEGATLYMVMLAAFQVVLHRYSGQDDLCVGSPSAGRSRPELEGLIGFFLNTLVLRTDLSGHPTFLELLGRVRQVAVGAFDHQDVPFERLVEELQPTRSLSFTPFFQVMLILQKPQVRPRLGALSVESLETHNGRAMVDLTLSLMELEHGELVGFLEYSTDLFDESTVVRLASHLRTVLEAAVASPRLPLHALPLLSNDERHQLLVRWNSSDADLPLYTCFHHLFEAQVALSPHAIAVADDSSSFSYDSLNRSSNRLAQLLVQLGAGPDCLISLLAPRDCSFLSSLLGILKSGSAWLPLDPLHPPQRLAQLLSLSASPFVLVADSLLPLLHSALALLPEPSRPRVLPLSSSFPSSLPDSNLPPRSSPSNLAYVIFTSGSTGTPKGAMLEQRGMLNHLFAKVNDLRLGPSDVVAQTASQCFDISVWQFFCALLVGGTTRVLSDDTAHSPASLLRALDSHRVSIAETVPSLLRALLDEADALGPSRPSLSSLRWMMPTGEALPADLVRRWLAAWPSIPLINAYGPTECSDDVAHGPLHQPPSSALVPIGRPVLNTRLYVLDSLLQPLPIGVPGELFVGGAGVGRGYLFDASRTAEAFIPDAFSSTPGSRLYRTGDRARWLHDGTLEFLGRLDFQVKVRGFRIEPGEVEACLASHPSVGAAAVLVHQPSAGDARLVAYVCPKPGLTLDSDALRLHLRQHLPEYMLPSALVPLDALPLTPNGKLDRKALPAPSSFSDSSRAYAAPRTRTEEVLTHLFARLLQLPRVGLHDDFFQLGGHSLLATRLASLVRQSFGVELPLRLLFEAPSPALLAPRLDELRANPSSSDVPPLRAVPREGPLPLSFSQQRLWFLDQWQPNSPLYNVPSALWLEGPLQPAVLQRCFDALVLRHEALRTRFASTTEGPQQLISSEAHLPLALVDLSELPEARRDEEARRLAVEEAQRPFDLATGPLLRVHLLRLGDQRHLLVLTMHHIVSDDASIDVMLRELVALYGAFLQDAPSPLEPLPLQYADYALWQREWLRDETLEARLDWWRQHLGGAPHALELPTDRPRLPEPSHRGATLEHRLPRALSDALRAFHRREGVTPFMTLLAATEVLLHRYSGQEDFLLGTPVAGREQHGLEGLVGFFVNTLVLRARLHGGLPFRELLTRVKAETLESFTHQEVPFEKLVEALQPRRDPSRTPLFQVMVIFQQGLELTRAMPGLTLRPLEVEGRTSRFDLSLAFTDSDDGLRVSFEYSTDLYDEPTVLRLAGHLQVLLDAIVTAPERRLSELPLLTAPEQRQLLVEWNDTRLPLPPEPLLHRWVEAQVDRTPDAIAVSFEGQHLTYAAMEVRANQLAWHLQRLGVGPEVRVALCLERSLEMVVGLLAVLKAGGAWVPLEPSYPSERLEFMLGDAGALVLLTQERLRPLLPATSAHVLALDSCQEALSREPSHRPVARVHPDGLAYVIYTSGSTGRPKGAMNTHAAICNRLRWMQDAYGLTSEDRVLQKTPFGFDVSVWEFFWPLLTGARLVMAIPGGHQDGAYLARTVATERVTTLHFVPSMLQSFLEQPGLEESCSRLRRIICSGEALPADLQQRCLERLPARLYNLYGPTEAAVDVTHWTCVRGDTRRSVPIGRPIANLRIHLLDPALRPVPVGVPGELYIGGLGLARGYSRRPDLTAERFVPDAFATEPGARLYRTGDLARYLPGGEIEYLGRTDFQVKLRGFRIELGEIEAVLARHPAVREAVVMAREDVPGDKRLVGYVTARAGQPPTDDALRAHLARELPEYMVPSALVVLEALPLTPNGKVDRKALPAPTVPTSARAYVAPRTRTEELLTSLFAQLLRVERVGLHDDFFQLGGHSLLATRLVLRVRESLGVELPLRTTFEAATPARLAERVESLRSGPATPGAAPALLPAPRQGPLPLSFSQQRLWFLWRWQPESALYNLPAALELDGELDADALERCFSALSERHEALRTTFRDGEHGAEQLVQPPAPVPLPRVDLSALPPEEREREARRLATEEAQRPFDLTRGPLLRTTLVRLEERRHLLLLTLHHIVFDGGSMDVLLRELAALHEAFSRGQPSPLPPLAVQYGDYAAWQRGWLRGEALEAQLAWWRQQLAGVSRGLELPTDRPRPALVTHHGAVATHRLEPALAEALRAFHRRERVTPFMTYLAALQALLHRYSGQDDVTVGTPVSGRVAPAMEDLIGLFVNTLVLRSRLEPHTTFRELLARAREATLGALAHQDVPFERVVEALQPERDLSRTPLFQVMLVYQEGLRMERAVPGLTLRPRPVDGGTAKFDLTLYVTEAGPGVELALEYNADLFEEATARRLLGHLAVLLRAATARPEQAVLDLPLLTEAEHQRLVVEWNPWRDDFARAPTLHRLFEAQAARAPDAIAVTHEEQHLTYRELDIRANRLAWRLRELGVGPETLVGLCVERSLELVVGLLAILKAGGAYVPMDPTYPAERLAFMLEDTAVRVLLVQSALQARLPAHRATVVLLDGPDAALEAGPSHAPDAGTQPGNLAYVIYTSGSTGRPKGVQLCHEQVVRLFTATEPWYHFDSRDVWALFHSYAFDFSVWELWGALLYGGRVVVVPYWVSRSPENLLALLRRERVTVLNQTPSAFRPLIHASDSEGEPGELSLRYIIFGGEALEFANLRPWFERYGDRRPLLVNMYGITETTVHVTYRPLALEDTEAGAGSIIGVPIPDQQAFVLDSRLRPVPQGVTGELYVGGKGNARGYLHRPELTAERFVPHPFSPVPGERLYKTGDLARFRADGQLEHLGRSDHQVKIRGYRIELGEIEAALAQHPTVREAVVVAREDAPGVKRLVGYVVSSAGRSADAAELREHLQQRLPQHMVPAVLIVMDALPLTSNGKVDRRALPTPETERAERTALVEPGTPVEHQLAAIWARVLGREKVGIHDNFFALGGDSIISLQIIARARRVGLHLTPRQLFQYPTVAQLASVVTEAGLAPAEEGPSVGPVPLTPIQRWFLARKLKAPHHFNQAVVVELREPVDAAVLEQALGHVLAHHDALRLRLIRAEDGWRQECAPPGAGVVPRRVEAEDLTRVAEELQRGLSLEEGRLVAAAMVEGGAGRNGRLLLVIHHLAVDGVSWRTLMEDLGTACQQLRAGHPVALPPRSTSFKRWAERLEAHATSPAVAAELPFWLNEARTRVLPLPRSGGGGANTYATARAVVVSLEEEETRLLLQEVPAAYRARLDDVLLAALALALGPWTRQPRLLVGLEGHGREDLFEDVDLSRTVGWFTSLHPVLLEVPGQSRPGEAVRAVRDALARVPGRGLGYGLLRHLAGDEVSRRLGSLPAAEVSFNYLGQLDTGMRDQGPFALLREPSGATVDPEELRPYVLEVEGFVLAGRLDVRIAYSEALHARDTIQALATRFVEALRDIISGRRDADATRHTPADFPLAGLTQASLERILRDDAGLQDVYPLSPMQQGMLFHALFEPEVGMYLEQLTWTFRAPLHTDTFRQAWLRLVERHPLLRTALYWEGLPEPLQVVRPHAELPWRELDWSGVSPDEQRVRLESFLDADRAEGFDLGRPPLMRVSLIRLDARATHLVWSYHHLLLDGWSLGLLVQELFATYQALLNGQPAPRPPVPAFREYVAWLRRQDSAAAEVFWRRALRGFTAPTPLPLALPPPPAAERVPPGEQQVHLSRESTDALRAFAREHQLTLNTLVQATWGLVLGRHAGAPDALFGTTVSGRPPELPDVEAMVGLFINALPVRVRLEPHVPVLTWLRELQAWLVEMRQHEHTPLVQVQGWSELPRGTSLFDSFLVFENYPVDTSVHERGSTLEIRDVRFLERINYPLAAMVIPDSELMLRLAYDAARFTPDVISVLLAHWRTALEAVLARPEQRLGELSLLTPEERHHVLAGWSGHPVDFPRDVLVHALFEAQVARAPQAPAVSTGDATLTFAELDARANQLAWHLRSLGVRPETRVGLCVERSLELVVGILGILKAGGAWVPMDPTYPAERLAFMLEDAGAPVLLTQDHLADALPAQGTLLVCLDTDWPQVATQPVQPPPSPCSPDNLAYVIYTSGSTGRPKGTLLTHRGLSNTALAAVREHGFLPHSRVLQFASIGFDASVCEVFASLLAGACLHLAPRERLLPGAPLHALLRERAITAVTLTPSVLAQLEPEGLEGLETVISAGEACPPEVAARWKPGRRFLNAYGPTEVTVCATLEARVDARQPTIGRPFPNARVYVLDEHLRPLPPGIPGELYVGGPGVARGYLGRPDLTAERFVPDAFASEPGARLYRTGDRVRWLPSGTLQFLGRLDTQVKLRGFRIEPGEVESVLREHPSIREAAVLVREDSPGVERLVAYVVADAPVPGEAAVRAALEARLPGHMVPAALVFLEAFPLTPHGKLDRRALPAPGVPAARAALYVAPRNAVEELLAQVWAELLGAERVGVHDDFFELGGHSLAATQLVARLRAVFERELSLQELFEGPTVARLAARLDAPHDAMPENVPPPTPRHVDGDVPLSFAQEVYWSPERQGAGSAHNLVLTPLRLEGPLDVEALRRTLEELVRRHEPLRTAFPTVEGRPVQRVSPPGRWELPVEELDHLPEEAREAEVARRLADEGWRPFDLEQGPLMRTRLYRLSDGLHVLLASMHHAITDLVSGLVQVRELAALYGAFRDGQPSPLPELPLGYRDFTLWQHEWMRGDVLERHRAYWRQRLAAPPPPAPLPFDHPRPGTESFRKARHSITLTPARSAELRTLARREGVTPFMLGLAALKTFLARVTRQVDMVVGVVQAHRPRPELEPLVGMFASHLPLRTDLSGNPGFREVLRRVRAGFLEDIRHQGLPHAEWRELLRPGVEDGRPPCAIGYVFQASAPPTVSVAGLSIREVPVDLGLLLNDVQLLLADGPEGLTGTFEYKAELFEQETIVAMTDGFRALLERVAEEPDLPLESLPLGAWEDGRAVA